MGLVFLCYMLNYRITMYLLIQLNVYSDGVALSMYMVEFEQLIVVKYRITMLVLNFFSSPYFCTALN